MDMQTIGGLVKSRPAISVIIPVYNTERYLEEMLESVALQTFTDYEAIIINDGSTDGSQEIIDRYCESDPRFKCFNQANQGVAAARNRGLDQASGQFVAFYDPDDKVPLRALEKLHKTIIAEDADVSIGIMKEFYAGGNEKINAYSKKLAQKSEISRFDDSLIWSFSLTNKLFRREVIRREQLRFENIKHTEDGLFVFQFMHKCSKITGCNAMVYLYRRRPFWEGDSITQSASCELLADFIYALDHIAEIAEKNVANYLKEVKNSQRLSDAARDEASWLCLNYRASLYNRLVTTSLVNGFYRQIWKTSDPIAEIINEKIDQYKVHIFPDMWKRIKKRHSDLDLGSQLKEKDELYQEPYISFILADGISKENVNWILKGIYFQMMPSFEVIVSGTFEDYVEDIFKAFPNFYFCGGNETTGSFKKKALQLSKGAYINLINEDLAPDRETIYTLYKKLYDDPEQDFAVSGLKSFKDGVVGDLQSHALMFTEENIKQYRKLDWMWGNKLFRAETLRESGCFSDDSAGDIQRLYQKKKHANAAKAYMFASLTDEELIDGCQDTALKRVIRQILDVQKQSKENKILKTKMTFTKKAKRGLLKLMRHTLTPRDKVLFLTTSGNELKENTRKIYEAFEGAKVVVAGKLPYPGRKKMNVNYHLLTSKVIVTEEEIPYLNSFKRKENQYLIRVADSCGLIKKKALAASPVKSVKKEKALYKHYDYCIVEDKLSGDLYAMTTGIDRKKILPLGLPAYDCIMNVDYIEKNKQAFYKKYPQLQQKELLLFCPTLQTEEGWGPRMDWDRISGGLLESQVLIIKKPEGMNADPLDGKVYPNIIRLDREPVFALMIVSNAMVTDYSDFIFAYRYLNKPILLYCADYEQQKASLFFDFKSSNLGAPLSFDEEQLLDLLRRKKRNTAAADYEMPSRDDNATDHNLELIRALLAGKQKI